MDDNTLSPSFGGGWTMHRRTERELWAAIRQLSERIPAPVQPWRQPFQFELQPNTSSPDLFIAPGVVYAPWTSSVATNVPRVHYYPHRPLIGAESIYSTGEDRPSIALTPSETNYIFLELSYTSYDYAQGGVDWNGSGLWAWEVPYSLIDSTGTPGTPNIADGTNNTAPTLNWGIRHFEYEQNYYLNTAKFVAHDATGFAWPATETAGFFNIYVGQVVVDSDGLLESFENLIEGAPVWAPPPQRAKDTGSQKNNSMDRTLPEAPATGTTNDPDIP